MLAFTCDEPGPPESTREPRTSSCLIRADGTSCIVDAIYAELCDFDTWARGITDAAADALGRRNDIRVEVVDRWVDSTTEAHGEIRVVGHPDNDSSIVIAIPCSRVGRLTPYDRLNITRIAFHLENAARFRRSPTAARGRFSLDGEWSGRSAAQSELWLALVEGRASLLPGRTGYQVQEWASSWRSRRALNPIELQSVVLGARGMSGKEVAYNLGVSTGRVCRAVADAAAKVGAKAASELVRIAARLGIDDPPEVCDAVLTITEREVLELVRLGMSNEAIAEARGRSPRTIANQVASLLRKTGRGSRRALTAACLLPPCRRRS